jgi:hypothetical protein
MQTDRWEGKAVKPVGDALRNDRGGAAFTSTPNVRAQVLAWRRRSRQLREAGSRTVEGRPSALRRSQIVHKVVIAAGKQPRNGLHGRLRARSPSWMAHQI